ncbi:MAG: hypothetical protein LBN00_02785 [Oscillospiraceae bacterium]|jgi:hypothetical protein|nr:hypothetical protein [Oscillospiraceae bacterium]
MLGKLLKHEFRATGRVFLPFYGAMFIVAIVTRILSGVSGNGISVVAPQIIGIVVTALLMGAVCVIAIILTVQRFNKNLLGDEGYLMFTLPTSTDSLICSKLIVSVVWYLASSILAVVALAIAVPIVGQALIGEQGLKMVLNAMFGSGAVMSTLAVLAILSGLLSIAWFVLSVYAAGSLAMLSNRRRGLAAFGFWIAISTVAQIIGTLLLTWAMHLEYSVWWTELPETAAVLLPGFVLLAIMLIADAVLYIVTRIMLKKKLNLE